MLTRAICTTLRLICFSLCFTLLVRAQQVPERVLNTERLAPGAIEVLAVSNLQVEGQPVTFGNRFEASDDWAKGLRFEVKNVSDKVITYFELGLQAVAPDGRHPSLRMFSYGTRPETPTVGPARRMLPGEVVQVDYSEKFYRAFQRMQADFNLAKVGELTLVINFITFEDDTAWRHGFLMRRDPSDPLRWIVIGREHLVR
ncbi:MAG: hypothetical protein HYR56_00765 [Acidobacteria bacterium]|nr:hypothetical protein [Acidobacteriota bacterium]MBI3422656.1 hypothetical protein [Acidobacteriota bacterium]